jgi:hypothetical protein
VSRPRIKIALPFPLATHSHNKGHWRAKAGPIKAMREHACLLGRQAVAEHGKIVGPFEMSYTIHVPDMRRRDTVNMLQQCKPYLDGIVDSDLIEGDHWAVCQLSEVNVFHDKGISHVVLEFWK